VAYVGKKVGVTIQHPEVWEEFKAYVVKKWGKKHTAMALELEEAIKEYLSRRAQGGSAPPPPAPSAHTQRGAAQGLRGGVGGGREADQGSSGSRTMRSLKRVVARILQVTEYEMPQTLLEKIIAEAVGGDERTLRRYTRMLVDYEVLRPSKPMTCPGKFIYEVDVSKAMSLLSGEVDAEAV